MAYVESFYLDANPEAIADQEQAGNSQILEKLAADDVAISQYTHKKEDVMSDYCGFESDEMPPVYRAQMRHFQKKMLIEKEEKEKSQYAYPVDLEREKEIIGVAAVRAPIENGAKMGKFETHFIANNDYYVPGFSPPQQNEDIHKMDDFKLPNRHAISMTEHVFHIANPTGFGRQNEASQYILMPDEEEKVVQKKGVAKMDSAASFTDTGFSTESSILTAQLGPAFGCLPSARTAMSPAPKSLLRGAAADKYKGLSAFRPVSGSIESQYAFPELN